MIEYEKFRYFPEERMNANFPFGIWLAGAFALTKGIIWLFFSSITPGIFLFPFFLVFGFGVWNKRRWAWWGIVAVSVVELVAIIFVPHFSCYSNALTGEKYDSYTVFFNRVIGPAADAAMLVSMFSTKEFFFPAKK